MMKVSGWGRLSAAPHRIVQLLERQRVGAVLREELGGIAHGLGRSYGDAALNVQGGSGLLWSTRTLDRMIAFDPDAGRLRCEAGVSLLELQRLFVPRGWMLPVSPGTQFVTVGGAIANDVHGKNHHALGSFGDHVSRLALQRTDGEVIECGPDLRPEWFAATVGGIGLTGVILWAELRLRPVTGPWLDTETLPYETLDEFFALSAASERDWEYTVSWIDCLSASVSRGGRARGLFMRGNHASAADGPPPRVGTRRVPITPPVPLINGLSLRAFNALYFHKGRLSAGRSRQHYQPFFYPLDALLEWNRIYGPLGFHQYQ
ncbi:FAD-binding oxidoreductase, partial [Pelomonas sp. HMWF004]